MNISTKKRPWLTLAFITVISGAGCQKGCDDTIYLPEAEKAPGRVVSFDCPSPATPDRDPEDERFSVGWWPRLAKDTRGRIHLVYCDAEKADLKYALYDGSSWNKSTVVAKDAVGKYLALAVDSRGYPHVTFYNQDSRYYNYARQDEAGWHFERLSYGVELGAGAAITLDKDDLPHIIFYSINGHLAYLHRTMPLSGPVGSFDNPNYQSRDDAVWQNMPIGKFGGSFSVTTDLRFAPDGSLMASFVNSQLVKSGYYLGRLDGNSWQVTGINGQESPGWSSKILFDAAGPLLIHSALIKDRLYLSRLSKEGPVIDKTYGIKVGTMTADYAPDGTLYIAHQYIEPGSTGFGMLRLLTKKGDTLHWYAVDGDRDSGKYLDMVFDRDGHPLIAYYNPVSRCLNLYTESANE